MKKTFSIVTIICAIVALSGCRSPKEVAYFQNVPDEAVVKNVCDRAITILPDDKLSIFVKSRDPQLSQMFNLVIGNNGGNYGDSHNSYVYSVDSNGDIDFPALGKLHVAGMTREAVATYIKNRLQDENQVKDPIVIVDFRNLYYSVIGEVNSPGRHEIDKDRITILDAIAASGDLTIQGRRTNVMVLRKEASNEKVYRIDLTDINNVMSSPAYQIKQNDVVYVEPNKMRTRQTTANGNSVLTPTFWISIASFLSTMGVLIYNIVK